MTALRGARTMALGTIASRATGFVRTTLLVTVLGVKGVATAFNVANTVPNVVYELLVGGILTSLVVPLLVRANHEGEGEAYVQRLLTLALVALGAVSALLVVLAPQLVDLYLSDEVSSDDRELAITFARFFLPQVLLYGLGAIIGAYLNTKGRFGPPMWAPVLNNLVVIVTLLVFLLLPSAPALTSASISREQVLVLGVGVTAGILAQTVALLPALRATGLRLRPRLDLRGAGLGRAGRLATWSLLYVACNQLAFVVVVRLATGTGEYPSYVYAFVLWQLPHAVVAVSVITALLPAMSQSVVESRLGDVRRDLDRGLRLTIALLVPATAAYVVLGRPLATALFGHGETSPDEARMIGTLLAVFACGLLAFSTYQLQLRAFYALQDTRTATLINLAVNATLVLVDVVLFLLLPKEQLILGLAAGQASSFLVGVLVCSRVLARRLPREEPGQVGRTVVRCLTAALPAALVVALLVLAAERGLDRDPLAGAVVTGVGGVLLAAGYLLTARRLRIREVEQLLGPIMGKIAPVLPGARRTR